MLRTHILPTFKGKVCTKLSRQEKGGTLWAVCGWEERIVVENCSWWECKATPAAPHIHGWSLACFQDKKLQQTRPCPKDFFHTLFLGHDSCNRQPLDFLGNIYNMMIVCSRPLHHLEGVGESHPTRSHLTSFASLENHNEIHFGSNCGCGHSAGQCLLFALRASFVHTHQHWEAEVLW